MAKDRTKFDAENTIQMTYELDNGIFGTHTNHCGTERGGFDLLRTPQAHMGSQRITGYLNGDDVEESVPAANSLGLDKIGAWLRAIETGGSVDDPIGLC